jgi:hypothetical protein
MTLEYGMDRIGLQFNSTTVLGSASACREACVGYRSQYAGYSFRRSATSGPNTCVLLSSVRSK